jgi:DNA-binding LacI/PurR family transcriptional regulator
VDIHCPIVHNLTMSSRLTDAVHLSPRARAIQTIEDWITEGRLSPGSRLPGEEHLATSLGVARGTVRQSLHNLVERGVLQKEPNRGHVVCAHQKTGSGLLSNAFLLIGEINPASPDIPGYSQALDLNVVRRLHGLGHHVMHIAPERMSERLRDEILTTRPLGAICGFEALHSPNILPHLLAFHREGLPVSVASDRPETKDLDRAIPDHAGATAELVRRLVARGRRRICRVWTVDPPTPWLIERNAGFESAARACGIAISPPLITKFSYERNDTFDVDLFERRARLFAGHFVDILRGPDRPDALMAITDADAVAFTAACRLCGLDPAADIDVVGYDGYWADTWERRIEPLPPVFSVDKHNAEIGSALVDLVLQRIANPHQSPQLVLVPPTIQSLRL